MQSFPEKFSDIGGRTFEQVFKSHKEFVDFTLTEMEQPTKLFKRWQDFCKRKMNEKPAIGK